MSDAQNLLVITLNEEEADLLKTAQPVGSSRYMQNMMREQLQDGKNRVALADEQIGKVLRSLAVKTEPTHELWLSAFRRPLMKMLEQVSVEPPART